MTNQKGFIYKVESPEGKIYIGQVVEYINRKKAGLNIKERKGIEGRWKQHINSARSKSRKGSPYLNKAIIKYGPDKMTISQLMKVNLDKLDLFEEFYIKIHNSLAPNGYNLQKGGTFTKHSEETCIKRGLSIKKTLESPEIRKKYSDVKKGKKLEYKRNCKNKDNQYLPPYINIKISKRKLKDSEKIYIGYYVDHPKGYKTFAKTSKFTSEELLEQAINYIYNLENR